MPHHPSTTPPPLPAFPAPPQADDREQAALEASRVVVALLLRARSTAFSVQQLAEHTGLSERTFYRYFPRKEQAIRPYLTAALAHVVAGVREAQPSMPLRDVLVEAHGGLLALARAHGGEAFLDIVSGEERFRAVWVQVLADAERAFAEVIAARLGLAPSSVQARLAGAAVVAAGRVALTAPDRDAADPLRVFAACLDLLGFALLVAPRGA